MPNLRVIRPADANETVQAWRIAVDHEGPTALILSRQSIPVLEETVERAAEGVPRGAYVLRDESGADPDLVLVGTGSEVHVCLGAADLLEADGVAVRVVSFPSWGLFAEQAPSYRERVLPAEVPKLSVEAATTFGWERYVDASVGIDHFGASAPGERVLKEFGFSPDHVAERARALLAQREGSLR
jgi:transketolase